MKRIKLIMTGKIINARKKCISLSTLSKLFISQAQKPAQFPSQVFLADWRKLR